MGRSAFSKSCLYLFREEEEDLFDTKIVRKLLLFEEERRIVFQFGDFVSEKNVEETKIHGRKVNYTIERISNIRHRCRMYESIFS